MGNMPTLPLRTLKRGRALKYDAHMRFFMFVNWCSFEIIIFNEITLLLTYWDKPV